MNATELYNTTSNASFDGTHEKQIRHTKKCLERFQLKSRNNCSKYSDSPLSSKNDCLGTCTLISSAFKQFLDKYYITSLNSKGSPIKDDNKSSENMKINGVNKTNNFDDVVEDLKNNAFKDHLSSAKHGDEFNSSSSERKELAEMNIDDSSNSQQDTDDSSMDSNSEDCDKVGFVF